MLDKTKAPILILVFLVLVALLLAGGGFYLLQQEKTKTASLEKELETVKAAQKATEAKLADTKKMAADLEAKLMDAAQQIETISRALSQEKTARQEAASKMELMKTELEQQKKSQIDLEAKFTEAQETAKTLQAQLKALDTKKAELETKVKDLQAQLQEAENKIELGRVVVTPETGDDGVVAVPTESSTMSSAGATLSSKAAPRPAVTAAAAAPAPVSSSEGAVLVINKEYNFAVINLGLRDGVRVGDVFSVYRLNKYIGDIRVDKVHDAMAAAGFVSQDLRDKVAEGDKVVLKAR